MGTTQYIDVNTDFAKALDMDVVPALILTHLSNLRATTGNSIQTIDPETWQTEFGFKSSDLKRALKKLSDKGLLTTTKVGDLVQYEVR